MVQKFNVLRCFSCKRFQVHQVKKAKTWVCKVCGEKQSTAKIYGQGSAPDCRRHVQKLNTIQGEREQLIAENVIYNDEESTCYEDEVETRVEKSPQGVCDGRDPVGSRWAKFIEVNIGEDEEEQLWNGMPVTMNRRALGGEKKKIQQKKKQEDNHNSEEFLPAKKRRKTRDFENKKDYFHHKDASKIRESEKMSGRKWEAKNTIWENLNSSPEKDQNEKMLAHNNGGKSKWKNFATRQTESENYGSFKNQVNKLDARNRIDCNEETTLNNKMNSQNKNKGTISASKPKTTESKWLKFLGSSSLTSVEEEEEEEEEGEYFDDLKFDACQRNLVKSKTPIPGELTCNRTADSNVASTFESTLDGNNPTFLINAKNTSSRCKTKNFVDDPSQPNQQPSSIVPNSLFTIEDNLDGDWWNI